MVILHRVRQPASSTLEATQWRSFADPRTVALFPGGELLLDLGCGDGVFLDQVAGRYRRAIGFDVSTRRFSTRGRDPEAWEFVIADLNEGIPAETGRADAVHANQVIEHMHNPLFLAREVRRVLRPAGIFVAATPNVRYLKHVAALVLGGRGPMTSATRVRTPDDWDGGHIHYLTPKDLRWIAREAGFSRCSVQALIGADGALRPLRPMLDRYAKSWPVREFLSGNSLLIAYA
jgi:SAM-dependent methyltransferase